MMVKYRGKRTRLAQIIRKGKAAFISLITIFSILSSMTAMANAFDTIDPKEAYEQAEAFLESGDKAQAAITFAKAIGYKDARTRCRALWKELQQRNTIATSHCHAIGLRADGTVVAAGSNEDGQCNVSEWENVISVAAGGGQTIDLDAGRRTGGYLTLGIKADGTVLATGNNDYGQCDVSEWRGIAAVDVGYDHVVALKTDGTVLTTGRTSYGCGDVQSWSDIISVKAGSSHTVGLHSDGTVIAVGSNGYGQCDVSGWKDIVAIAAGQNYTVGLKADGTVIAVGENRNGQCNVDDWTDIVAIDASYACTVGLRADGTAVKTKYKNIKQDISAWTDISSIVVSDVHIIGLKSDGTAVFAGVTQDGIWDLSTWTDIKKP